MKHRIVINVTNQDGEDVTVLKGADISLPQRLLKFLFGEFTQVYLLAPGQSVQSVDVKEVGDNG